jgi:transcriptional adapter 3
MSAPTPPAPFVPLPGHPPLRTALLKQPLPDAAPPTTPLEALQAELQALLPVARSRGRQANDALRILDESNRRMKEREKGKARAVHTVKKERGCACSGVPVCPRHR